MRRFLPLLLMGATTLSACQSSSSETYVVVDFVGAVSTTAPIASISLDLEMGGEKSGAAFTATGTDGITLPTNATLRVGHGSGTLTIFALAKSADGQELGRASGRGPVVAGKTQHIEVRFGGSADAGVTGTGEDGARADAAPAKKLEDAGKTTGEDAMIRPDGTVMVPDGAGGSGGSGGGGTTGSVVVLADAGGLGGRISDANSTAPDASVGGANTAGASGLGGAGGTGGVSVATTGVPDIISEPSVVDFGSVNLGKPAGPRTIIIRNAGTAAGPALKVDLLPVNGPFSINSEDCAGRILVPGDKCSVTLAFTPTVKGVTNGKLLVKAGSVSGTDVNLSGTGGAPPPPELNLLPPKGDFGPVAVGSRGSVIFTLTNNGSSPANGVVVSNSGGPVFQINNDQCGNRTLQPNTSCTFSVLFVPTDPGPANGSLAIKCQGLPEPIIVDLSGAGKDGAVLTVNLQGNGSGTVNAPGLTCQGTVCTGQYDPGTAGISMTLNAKPGEYSNFAGWSGGPCNGIDPACTFVLMGPTTITAKFTADTARVSLGVLSLQGHTGSISSSDGILSCSGQCPPAPHPKTASLVLVATPDAGSTFVGWTEGPCQGANPTCTIPLTNDIHVSGTFGPQAYMFVTSTSVVPGKLGGLAGADAECAARAQAGRLPGTYRAWLSTAGIDAKSRVGDGGWVRVDGRPFARNLATLATTINQIVYYPPRIDELGRDVATGHIPVATGSKADGSSSGDQCAGYTNTTGGMAVGDVIAGSTYWGSSQWVTDGCEKSYRLYCFNTSLAGDLQPAPEPGKRIFISKSSWSPFGDIGNADAFCRADAVAANLPNANTFVALLATSTVSASSRLTSDMGPWRRVDDVLVFHGPGDMANNILLATPGVLADGTYGDFVFWSGAGGPGQTSSRGSSCQDWSSSSSVDYGMIGNANLSATPEWFASPGNGNTCDSMGQRLLCAEP